MTSTLRRLGALTALPAILALAGCGDLTAAKDSAVSASTAASSASSSLSSRASVAANSARNSASAAASNTSGRAGKNASTPATSSTEATDPSTASTSEVAGTGAGVGSGQKYQVVSVVDGDTIKVRINGEKVTVRLIGVDTPETKKPHVAVQCYGKEASAHMQSLVQEHSVQLVTDPTQGSTDKYGRLLRYVYVGDTNVGYSQIEGGYAREYTYDKAYRYQAQFRAAQAAAQGARRGTWGGSCNGFHTTDTATASGTPVSTPSAAATSTQAVTPSATNPTTPPAVTSTSAPPVATSGSTCTIKGNISASGTKIAHVPGSATYARTRITESSGERMFCSEAEAISAGWRIAKD